jgi:hypothetical protein
LGGNGSDWFDVSGDRVGNVTRFRLSRASPTTAVTIRLVFAIGSTPGSSTARSAASTARGASRSFWQWASLSPLARVTQAERRELRLTVSSRLRAAVCARSSNGGCCRWRAASTRPLSQKKKSQVKRDTRGICNSCNSHPASSASKQQHQQQQHPLAPNPNPNQHHEQRKPGKKPFFSTDF